MSNTAELTIFICHGATGEATTDPIRSVRQETVHHAGREKDVLGSASETKNKLGTQLEFLAAVKGGPTTRQIHAADGKEMTGLRKLPVHDVRDMETRCHEETCFKTPIRHRYASE